MNLNFVTNLASTTINTVGDGKNTLVSDTTFILNFIIGALGLVAVAVIVVGGIGYMSSAGDPGKVKKAKDTILYGVIGLVVCALAFAIVNFVIGGIGSIGGGQNVGSYGTKEECEKNSGHWNEQQGSCY